MQPTVSIDRQQLADFERTIARTITQGKKSVSGAMIQASVFAAQSAAKSVYGLTKGGNGRSMGAKNRKSRRHTPREKGKSTRSKFQAPWWSVGSVDIWSKGKMKTKHFMKESTFQRARAVPRRGLAGNAWRATAGKGMKGFGTGQIARRHSSRKVTKTNDLVSRIKMSNSLEYIQKVAPQSAQDGIKKATNKLQAFLDKKLARDIEKAFQRRQRG